MSDFAVKAPLLAYNSFVEALFVLNDCVSQASSSAMLQVPESERSVFSLRYMNSIFTTFFLNSSSGRGRDP